MVGEGPREILLEGNTGLPLVTVTRKPALAEGSAYWVVTGTRVRPQVPAEGTWAVLVRGPEVTRSGVLLGWVVVSPGCGGREPGCCRAFH